MSNKLWGYARVSTSSQNLDRQLDILRNYGVVDEDIHTDKISGSKKSRIALDELRSKLREGDVVIISSVSRLSRSTKDLLTILHEFDEGGITCIFVKEQFDMSTPTGKLLLTLMGALSELERSLIKDRGKEGLESARARGRIGGRPKISKKVMIKAEKLYSAKSHSVSEICDICKISSSSLYRYLNSVDSDKK